MKDDQFYFEYFEEYAKVSKHILDKDFSFSSSNMFKSEKDILDYIVQNFSAKTGLDAGCGVGARFSAYLSQYGVKMTSTDLLFSSLKHNQKNNLVARGNLFCADLADAIPLKSESYDLIICHAVIQHISPINIPVFLGEMCRVLSSGGVLELLFKSGSGEIEVYDSFFNAMRKFLLHETETIYNLLLSSKMESVLQEGRVEIVDLRGIENTLLIMKKN